MTEEQTLTRLCSQECLLEEKSIGCFKLKNIYHFRASSSSSSSQLQSLHSLWSASRPCRILFPLP